MIYGRFVTLRTVSLGVALAMAAPVPGQVSNTTPDRTPTTLAGLTDGSVPTALPPSTIAARNPNLTNEERGDIMMARKMFREAIDFYKIDAKKNAVLANKTGMAYHQLGDLRNAKKYYEQAIKIDKNYAEAINNRGTIQYAQKSYSRAMRDYQRALKLNPSSATVWMNLGTAQFARKKYQDAIQSYTQALSLDPLVFERRGSSGVQIQERSVEDRAQFYYMLAKTYAQAGVEDLTLRYVRFALENGFKERQKFVEDPEFAFLQQNAEFQAILTAERVVL